MSIVNLKKAKNQIKKATKDTLIYNAEQGFISDSHWVIPVEPSLLPTILEVFGSLESGRFRCGTLTDAVFDFNRLIDGNDLSIKITRTPFICDGEVPMRLYVRESKQREIVYIKLDIDEMFDWAGLGQVFEIRQGKGANSPIFITSNDSVYGFFLPMVPPVADPTGVLKDTNMGKLEATV